MSKALAFKYMDLEIRDSLFASLRLGSPDIKGSSGLTNDIRSPLYVSDFGHRRASWAYENLPLSFLETPFKWLICFFYYPSYY